MYNFFLRQSCSSFQTDLTNALHPRQQLFLTLQQLFQALDGVFQAARCTATALPVLHVLQAEEAVAAVELPLPTPASVRPVPHFSFSNEKRCLEEPSCAQYPMHSRYGQRKICTTLALARTFDGRALVCGRWCFTKLAIKVCDFVRRALHSGSREQCEFRSQKMVASSRSAFDFMQNNTAFNALSENHCKYTELAHQFGSRGAEGPIFLTLNPKPCLLKLLKLCSQGAHPTSSKTKSHTVFVALIETHCNNAELAHQFESRGFEGPIF